MNPSKTVTREKQSIHLADKSYLEAREVSVELVADVLRLEDEMQTLARLRFSVQPSELELLANAGLIEPELPQAVRSAPTTVLVFRTDRDLLDEEDDEFLAEWSRIESDPSAPLELWVDLDLWEFESILAG